METVKGDEIYRLWDNLAEFGADRGTNLLASTFFKAECTNLTTIPPTKGS